jgi:hypothetical protein
MKLLSHSTPPTLFPLGSPVAPHVGSYGNYPKLRRWVQLLILNLVFSLLVLNPCIQSTGLEALYSVYWS